MTWRDTLKGRSIDGVTLRGSFRGAAFVVPTSDAQFGRRVQIDELPLRDLPQSEDLGRRAREYSVEVFVDSSLSDDYLSARDALIAAIEKPGVGTLVHPWYGRIRAVVKAGARVREETRSGGRATFSITFVQVDETTYPAATNHTASAVQSAADTASAAAVSDFSNRWNVSGLPDNQVAQLKTRLASTLAGLEARVSGVSASAASDIRSPANMAGLIVGTMQDLPNTVSTPIQALQLYQSLFNAGDSNQALPTTTASRRQQATSDAAVQAVVQRSAVIEAARQSSLATYASSNDALSTRDILLDALDTQMEATDPVYGEPIDDAVYQALESLRAVVAEDLRTRGAQLPSLVVYTPKATLPALVVAHRIYGDATRADEIVSRNAIQHPGFVPGGVALEVLNA